VLAPSNPAELAEALRDAAASNQTIALAGNSTKRRMAGPIEPADIEINTLSLGGILQYEPRDLTISVGAGLLWCKLTGLLAENRQMIPLDPPFGGTATVGGVISANSSGPRRLLYGTARDLVIGMQAATLEGKLIRAGGMVVKNVAGLDIAKLLIGSFGTLGAITAANFKLIPMPDVERTFLLAFDSLEVADAARRQILTSAMQPAAFDMLNPAAAATLGNRAWLLAVRVGGSAAAVDRYERDLAGFAEAAAFEEGRQRTLWHHLENFTPQFLSRHADGAVVKVSCTLKSVGTLMASFPSPAIARAGSGVCYGYFENYREAADWMAGDAGRGSKAVIEFSPEQRKGELDLWPSPGADLEIMKRIKGLMDPGKLLNRGRLYRHI